MVQQPTKIDPQIGQLIEVIKTFAPDQELLERLKEENRILKTLYIQAKRDNQNIQKMLAAPPKKSLLQKLKFW